MNLKSNLVRLVRRENALTINQAKKDNKTLGQLSVDLNVSPWTLLEFLYEPKK